MRAICKVCKDKDNCSYLKRGREGDCIDVQTSDYGYQEAVEKACEWLREHNAFCYAGQYNINEVSETDFRKTMEGVV